MRRHAAAPTRLVRQWREPSTRGWIELLLAAALPAAVVTGVLCVRGDRARLGWDLAWLLPLTFVVTLLLALVVLNLRARLGGRFEGWNSTRVVVPMTLVVALATLPVAVVIAGTFPLLDAKVCTASGAAV